VLAHTLPVRRVCHLLLGWQYTLLAVLLALWVCYAGLNPTRLLSGSLALYTIGSTARQYCSAVLR
jgi:hypothetical protein